MIDLCLSDLYEHGTIDLNNLDFERMIFIRKVGKNYSHVHGR